MKTIVIEDYWSNGKLNYRHHISTDNKVHGLYEKYHPGGNIYWLCYYDMGKQIKLENYYYTFIDNVLIKYYV